MDPRAAFSHQHPLPLFFVSHPFFNTLTPSAIRENRQEWAQWSEREKQSVQSYHCCTRQLCRNSLEGRLLISCLEIPFICNQGATQLTLLNVRRYVFLSFPLWLAVCLVSWANNESWQDQSTLAVRMGVALAGSHKLLWFSYSRLQMCSNFLTTFRHIFATHSSFSEICYKVANKK